MDASPRTFFAWRQGVETNRIVLQWPLPREKRGQRRANAFISGVRARVGVSTAIRTIIGINQRAPLLSEVNPLAAFAYSRSIRWPPRLQLYRLRSVETVGKVEIRYTFGEENKFGILSPSKVRNGSVRSARKRNFSFKKYRKNTVPTVIIVLEFNSRYFIKLFFFVKLSGYFLNLNYSRASFFFRSRSLRN